MHHRPWLRLALSACALAPTSAAGDEPPADTGSPPAQDTKPEPRKLLAKTQFKNLRFQDDWSALADPEVTTDHWVPQMKWIELTEGWHLSTGGQLRYQWKEESNRNMLGTFPDHNEFGLVRARVYADLVMDETFRVYVEGLSADIHGQKTSDAPPQPIDRNDWGLQNAFIEFLADPDLRLRYGRTEMAYGAQRLISPLDWANTRRTFEGGVLAWKSGSRSTDFFVTHPVIVDPVHKDEANDSRWFSGVYNSWALEAGRAADAYLLHLHESDEVITAGDGSKGKADVYTLGTRYAGKSGIFDFEAEAALQGGWWAGDSVRAGMLTLVGGMTLGELPGAPRLALDLDWASGDDDATDSEKGTFNQLFPLAHAYFGYIDLIGRQNIVAMSPSARWKLGDTAWFRAAWHDFNLENDSDALYGPGGAVVFSDPSGQSGSHVGQEWDLTLGWTPPFMSPHGEFQFGYCYFVPGNYVEHLGDGDRVQLLFVQYTLNF